MASKENAATLPLAIVLVEFIFFRNLSRKTTRHQFIGTIIAIGLALFGLGGWIFFKGDLLGLFNYNFRYFSPLERLLTEPRVVVHYLSQIFYPVPTRLSIEHDIIVSKSLFDPWTTLPSILLIGSLIGFALVNITKRPVLSFSILFFFLNHLIESSIVGLELIFEHRNYLPSLFLFWPIAVWFCRLTEKFRKQNTFMFKAAIAGMIVIIAGFCSATYIRNFAWKSEKKLWEDAVSKAPKSGRGWHNLALAYYVPTGQFQKAMVLFHKALNLEKNNIYQESLIYSNMASVFYYQGDYKQAARYWTEALNSYRNNPEVQYLLCLALIKMGNYEEASKHLDRIAVKYPDKIEVLNLRGILAVYKEKYQEALNYFGLCFKLERRLPAVLVNAGAAYSLGGQYQKANWFFKSYLVQHENDKITLLWLVQNSMLMGDPVQAEIYLNRLSQIMPVKDLIPWIKRLEGLILYEDTTIIPEVDARIDERMKKKLNSAPSP